MNDELPPIAILSTADFDAEVWTNKQHLAMGLSSQTEVVYIESFGLRAPHFSRSDLQRVWRRLRVTREHLDQISEGPLVIRPRIIPFHASRLVRHINGVLVGRLPIEDLQDFVLWTFSPLTYGLEKRARAVVYHSVDLLHTQPGVPSNVLLNAEAKLLGKADRVIASSTGVEAHLNQLGRSDVLLWENVADTRLFGSARGTREPRALFAGNLTPTKVDADLLLAVVDGGTPLTIAGPAQIDGTSASPALRAVLDHPLVTYLGTVGPERLAYECARSTVGLIPYVRNDYTAGVFPLKVYEYLAAGLSVVSTPLPSLVTEQRTGVTIAPGERFAQAVREAIASFTEADALVRQEAAAGHSWERRIEQACELLREL